MKYNLNRSCKWKFISGSATVQHSMLWATMGLCMALFPFSVFAQYVAVRFNIPVKIGVSNIAPFQLSLKPADIHALAGTCVMCITGAENMQVLATLTSSDSIRNEQGHALPFTADLAFRNDGQSQPPGRDAGYRAFFPLSNSGRIADNKKDLSQVLNAYLFIRGNTGASQDANNTFISGRAGPSLDANSSFIRDGTGLSQHANTTYVGDIYLNIEYN